MNENLKYKITDMTGDIIEGEANIADLEKLFPMGLFSTIEAYGNSHDFRMDVTFDYINYRIWK